MQHEKPPCECGSLENWSCEPWCPIEFDERLNEYHVVGDDGSKTMIYYCLFCGGRAPESRRDTMFAHVDATEQQRIYDLFEGIVSSEDVIARFGEADHDLPVGASTQSLGSESSPKKGMAYRTLIYEHHSDVADLRFDIASDGRVFSYWLQKYIGGPTSEK